MENALRSLSGPLGISIVSVLLVTAPASAQRHVAFLVGPESGYNYITYRSDAFPVLGSEPKYYLVQNGIGHGYFWGLSGEDPLDTNMHHFFILEAGYDSKPGTFTTLSGGPPDTATSITGVKLWTTLSYIYVNLGYKYNFCSDSIPNGLGIQLCLSIGVKWGADFLKSVSDNQGQSVTNASAITTADALRLALRPELTYDLPFTDSWVLTPFAGYELPLTKVDDTENWWVSALYGGLALRYAIW
ncbi:MAG: hypothetical protein ACHQNE_03840 [Candidatus Kapaibacterium sp.]